MKKPEDKSVHNDDLPGRIEVNEGSELSAESEDLLLEILFKWWLRVHERSEDPEPKEGRDP